jgi:monofunctional biosynthetic peptidoglycan transglycosylase
MLKSIALAIATAFVTLFLYNSVLPPISTLMIARTLTFQRITRDYVPLYKISPALPRAVIAAEDSHFCGHWGVDWKALGNAVEDLADDDRDRVSGASTITMQLTKNLFLWPGRSYVRKGMEIPLALGLDLVWSKRRIMDRYLNIAEFGKGIFGAEAAARHYFRKSAKNLTTREAALLAATLPNPKKRNPARPSGYMAGYASRIESRAWQQETGCLR